MTDIWCFTCSHEVRRDLEGNYVHLDEDDLDGCVCAADGLECQP